MTISPIHGPAKLDAAMRVPPSRRPQGMASVPDRIEERRPQSQDDNSPSLFKEYLFDPIIQAVRWVIRGIFKFFDFLRRSAFDEDVAVAPAIDRQRSFLKDLNSAPRPEQIFREFELSYSTDEQNRLYRTIGEGHKSRVFWKEAIWERTARENIGLGRGLVRQNPFLLRDFLGKPARL